MMNRTNVPDTLIRTMQVIAGALISGVVIFAVIAVVALGALNDPPVGTMLSYTAIGLVVIALVPFFLVPSMITRESASRMLEQQGGTQPHRDLPEGLGLLVSVYQTQMIIRYALLEGAAFFNLMALILEHNWWSLGVTGGLVLWMLAMFPTRTRVEQWLETEQMRSPMGE